MAKILGKDQATYAKERDVFLRDLQHFHEIRGTPFKRSPTLGGKEVDLYLLYTLVTSQGGWLRANSKNTWPKVLPLLQLPASCVNGSVALKQLYLRYLDRWEKVHFLHEDADRASDDDEESRHKRWSARSLHSIPCNYNYSQHNVNEAQREFNHLSTNIYKPSDYERLSMSLMSPLPNEQDFAINVCTLLSNDGKHTLKLDKHPKLVNYLLAHAGVFSHSSLRQIFTHYYNVVRKRPIHTFWKDVLESQEFFDLTNEIKFVAVQETKKSTPLIIGQEDQSALLALSAIGGVSVEEQSNDNSDTDTPDCEIIENECDNFKLKINPEDVELFSLKRALGTQDYIGQRVLQIATILRNLSFIEENVTVLVKNTAFIRFLLLCSTSRWGILRNLGMDMLSNVASEFIVRDLQHDLLAAKLLRIITKGLESQDRAECLMSLELLNKLSQNEQNEDIMQRSLQAQVYKSVCSFLTLHDVMLLIYTLECLYSLSSLGERSCNFIVINHGVIDTLVSLVTVEGKSYGPKACIGMKLVETLPSGTSQQAQVTTATPSQPIPQNQPSTTASSTSTQAACLTNVSMNSISTITTVTTSTATPVVSSSPTPKSSIPTTPIRQVNIVPQRLLPINPTPVTSTPASTPSVIQSTGSMTPQQMIQQQHAHQQAIHENEQFALAWLRATYEPCSTGKVDHQEVYKHYLTSCSTIGRRGVISPLHFPRCVRSIFGGTVGPNPMKPANPSDPQYYEGIKVRDKPLIINIPPSSIPKPVSTTPTVAVPSVNTTVTTKTHLVRRKSVQPVVVSTPSAVTKSALTVIADNNSSTDGVSVASPSSPILKAQLSAPPKQRDGAPSPVSSKGDMKSQAMAHPHLSQALLGNTSTTTASSSSTVTVISGTKDNQTVAAGQTSNTSLIKSLLATKVNDCMSTVSMRTATDCQNVAQVAARQQRLLAQQGQQQSDDGNKTPLKDPIKVNRLNGIRQLFPDNEIGDPSVSSTTQFTDLTKGKKEPPQPPPPPLAPLSNVNTSARTGRLQRIDNEDSDSLGNNSLASSSGIGTVVGIGGVSSTEDGENSLTSFEGLLNGIPTIENALNEDSNSKDYVKIASSEITVNKPLRLADLLEKKFEKSPPMLNGALGKELRLGERTMDLVENHIEKALSRESPEKCSKMEITISDGPQDVAVASLKRCSSDEIIEIDAKRPLLSNVNGSSTADSPAPDSSSSNGDDGPTTVSTAAAKLFADMAADILEDEDEEQLLQEAQGGAQHMVTASDAAQQMQIQAQSNLQQIIMDQNNQQMLLAAQPRQIIVSSGGQLPGTNQMVISGTPMKTQSGQTVIVQNASGQRSMMLAQQNSGGQILLSQGLQGQMQIVANQAGQYVLQTSGGGGQGAAYVVAQPQSSMVHGSQPQTVLLAQTSQQQGTGAKTIIILQQQSSGSSATQHQKVMVTPQGQQVVVTQVPRPVMHTSSVSNNTSPVTKVIKSVANSNSNTATGTTQTPNANVTATNDKKDEIKRRRDVTTPYICEWNDCNMAKVFRSANEVYLHACEAHCPLGSEEINCQWDRCDNMKRKRFSLMTHLHDKHCNTESMKQSLVKRKQAAHTSKPEPPPPASPSPHPGYAPDAALHAIKRHALEFVNPKELQLKSTKPVTAGLTAVIARGGPPPTSDQDDNEGPVTKSIRLTASLILRNLVIYNSHCKRYLKSYESHLANVALSNVESSRTIAQILFDMNDSTHR